MKYYKIITFGLIFSICQFATSQNNWTQKANYPDNVANAVGFSIGNKGYLGLGWNPYQTNAFWQYNPLTDLWLQKSNFPGVFMGHSVGLTINNKGYIGTGLSGSPSTFHNEFWEYNSTNDTWTQKANFGGTPRSEATGFTLNGKGYIGTGWSQTTGLNNDFWEYDQLNDSWSIKANFPGTPRSGAVSFSINGKGYLGLGSDATGFKKDLWEYNPSTNQWTQKADFPDERTRVSCFIIEDVCYLGTGWASSGLKNDFWKYNAIDDIWTQVENAGVLLRQSGVAFTLNNKGYMGTGSLYGTPYYNDFWEYIPTTNLSINGIEKEISSLFPNPFINELNIELNNIEETTINIYDTLGREIFTKTFNVSITVNTEKFTNNIYFYDLKTTKGVIKKGMIIKETSH